MGARGFESHGQQGAPGGYYSQETKHVVGDGHGGQTEVYEKKEKKDGKGGMLAAGAGGLAVGAVGGAMIGHAIGKPCPELCYGSLYCLRSHNTSVADCSKFVPY